MKNITKRFAGVIANDDISIQIKKGEAIGQGIIVPYGVTEDDVTTGERLGGFGSTNG